MKKTITLIFKRSFSHPVLIKHCLLTFFGMIMFVSGFAANITSTASGGNWNNVGSWVGGIVPLAGDDVTIINGATVTVTAPVACTNITINGTLTLNGGGITLSAGGTWTNSGTFNPNQNAANTVTFGSGTFIAGTNPTTFYNLTINTTNPTDIVTLVTSGAKINNNGTLALTNGIFQIGAGNTFVVSNGQTATITASATGNFASTGVNGADGGTLNITGGGGNNITINSAGLLNIYNLNFLGNTHFTISNPSSVLINGTFTVIDNNWSWGGTNSPIYGPASTLFLNNNGQGYTPELEWLQGAPGTIGVTPGYPNNVTLMNVGTSMSNYGAPNETYGVKLSGTWSINGVFQVGSPTVSAAVDLGPTTIFTCGGIIIENGSRLRGPGSGGSFTVKGNWMRQGNIVGLYSANTGTITFAGSGTSATPQTIGVLSGAEAQLGKIAIDNGTYVKLLNPVILPAAGGLTLTSGIVETDAANLLTINNSALAAVTGGSASSYVNGPLAWNIAANNNYAFPVGKGPDYLPFAITPVSATVATVEAFNTASGGTPDNVTVSSLSNTEYWSLSTSTSFNTPGSSVSVTRATAVAPFNAIAKSSTVNGVYSAIGGTASSNSILNSSGIGTTSPWFFVIAQAPLAAVLVSTVPPTCANGNSGTITVAGSGGVVPYTFKIDNGTFSSNNVFTGLSEGVHIITIMDGANSTATLTVSLEAITLTKDTSICGGSVNLQASSEVGSNFTWTANTAPAVAGLSGTTGPNVTATPTATTTYTVSADIVTNLLQNSDFESGNTGFTSTYINLTGNPQIPYDAAGNVAVVGSASHDGIYAIVAKSNDLCTHFTSPIFMDHTTGTGLMFVSDGPSNGNTNASLWGETVTGLSTNTNYVFSFWVRKASSGDPATRIRTQINGVDLPSGTSVNPYTSTGEWTQVSYTWNSGSNTSAAINLFDEVSADIGNDFAIDDLAFLSTCQVTKTVTVTVVDVLAGPTAVPTQPTCTILTGSINVTAPSTGVTYSFDNGVTYQAEPTKSGLTPGSYQVVVKTVGGCISAASSVTIDPAPTAPAAPTATPIQPTCTTTTGSINVTAPSTGVTYSFDNGVTYQTGATKSGLTPGTYQVIVKSDAGCISAPSSVTIDPAPTAPAAPSATPTQPTCGTATGAISVTAPSNAVSYSFDNGATFQPGATKAGLAPGTYQVVVKNEAGCVSAASSFTIDQQPASPVVNAGQDVTVAPGTTVTLTGTSNTEGTYLWTASSGTVADPNQLITKVTPVVTTTYTLQVTAGEDCVGRDQVTVTIKAQDCPPLDPPKAFTPNGDGYHDFWEVAKGDCVRRIKVDIFNRWGSRVYHSDDYDNKWEGRYTGKLLPDGTYYYVITAFTGTSRQLTLTGNVTIIR